MGAKLNRWRNTTTCRMRNGVLEILDILGGRHSIELGIGLDFEDDSTKYLEDLLVNVLVGDTRLILRYDGTYTVVRESDRLLMTIGSFTVPEIVSKIAYKQIGYMSGGGIVSPLWLDVSNSILIHGRHGETKSNGLDAILKRPFSISDESIDMTFSLAHAHACPTQEIEFHVCGLAGPYELEVAHVLARGL